MTRVPSRPAIALLSARLGDLGGTETHVLQIAEHLGAEFCFYVLAACTPLMHERLEARGATVVQMSVSNQFDIGRVQAYRRFFAAHDVRLINTFDARSSITGRIAARLAGARVIHTYQISPLYYNNSRLRQFAYHLGEATLNWLTTDCIIFVSERTRSLYARRGLVRPRQACVIRNAVELEHFRAGCQERQAWRERFGVTPTTCVIGAVGQLIHIKGHDLLLKALSALPNTGLAEWKLMVVGSGPLHAHLEQTAQDWGLGERVRFLGYLPRSEIAGFLGACDLFVQPSRVENTPYTVIEALAAGLPCVVTDVGDAPFMVPDGVKGLVVPPNAPGAMTDALARLLADAELRARMAASAGEGLAAFSIETMIAQIEALYEDLL